jgi:hypothetical protein
VASTAVNRKAKILWGMTPCSLVELNIMRVSGGSRLKTSQRDRGAGIPSKSWLWIWNRHKSHPLWQEPTCQRGVSMHVNTPWRYGPTRTWAFCTMSRMYALETAKTYDTGVVWFWYSGLWRHSIWFMAKTYCIHFHIHDNEPLLFFLASLFNCFCTSSSELCIILWSTKIITFRTICHCL